MQKIATYVFIYSSIIFGIIGILIILSGPDGDSASNLNRILHDLILIDVCVILPSFALSIAGKYLKN